MRISDWSSDVCSSDLLEADIDVDARDGATEIGLGDKRADERVGTGAERALIFLHPRKRGQRLLARLIPRGVARVEVGQIPLGGIGWHCLVLRPGGQDRKSVV